jgi:hypothetical protein
VNSAGEHPWPAVVVEKLQTWSKIASVGPYLEGHTVRTARLGTWLRKGDLQTAAEDAGFDLFLTTDKICVIGRILPVVKSR